MANIIAGWKIDNISKVLTQQFIDKQNEVVLKMEDLLAKEAWRLVPEDLLVIYNKYPESIKMIGCAYFEGLYINSKVPYVSMDSYGVIKSNEKLKSKLLLLSKEHAILKLKKKEFEGKIKCTLSKLKTYKKIKDNFPEAYKILIEEIDKESNQKEDLCTNVEELRAELTKK